MFAVYIVSNIITATFLIDSFFTITVFRRTYLLRTKLEANSMKRLNSLPSQLYPRQAISNASRPKPAPGTSTDTSDASLREITQTTVFETETSLHQVELQNKVH